MFGIGETELVLILLFSFLVFGPDKLPGMGRTLGRALRQFRSAQEGFNKVVQSDLLDPAADVLNEKPKRSEKLRSAASERRFGERRARRAPSRTSSSCRRTSSSRQRASCAPTEDLHSGRWAGSTGAPGARRTAPPSALP